MLGETSSAEGKEEIENTYDDLIFSAKNSLLKPSVKHQQSKKKPE